MDYEQPICPNCGSDDIADADCPECDGVGTVPGWDNEDEEMDCEYCGGLGFTEGELECLSCGEFFNE